MQIRLVGVALLLVLAVGAGWLLAPDRWRGMEPGAGSGSPVAGDTQPWPRIGLEQLVGGLQNPIAMAHAGDGSGRLFVLEQAGRIRIIEDGKLLDAPFLDLTDRVESRGMEQGLLGLAFAPDYARSGIFYVHYTGRDRGRTVIARYRRAADDPLRGDPGSEEVLLAVPQPYANHNGGSILFGPDGYLYIALGDGGGAGDPGNRAQNLETLLGKILRIEVGPEGPYRIPAGNPFASRPGRDEIWAYGLRNPWRITFDRETGDLWIADVGQNRIEEVNRQPASSRGGENYGWNFYEGAERFRSGTPPAGLVFPVATYTHEEGGCAITGGYVYRGRAIPALTGIYLYGDFCTGKIWGLRPQGDRYPTALLLDSEANIAAFGEDEAGELYVVDRRGAIYRIRAAD